MSTTTFKRVSLFSDIAHWTACVLGTLAVLTFVVFAVGLGLPPGAELNASFAAVGVMLVGFLLIWWKDWLGGVVALLGLAWFQAMEIAVNGEAARGLFPLLIVPAAFALLAGALRGVAKQPMS